MRVKELEKTVKESIENEIEAGAGMLGLGDLYSQTSHSEMNETGLKNILGLCAYCKELDYCKGEYGTVFAKCNYYDIRLRGRERMEECTRYAKRGQMLLQEALTMAHIIDIDNHKIGF